MRGSKRGGRRQARPSHGPELVLGELVDTYGDDFLAQLLGVAAEEVRRIAAGERAVPSPIAARVAVIARVSDHISGSYDTTGMRRWWARPRAALGGRTPRGTLGSDWDPHGPDARAVIELARALAYGGGAT